MMTLERKDNARLLVLVPDADLEEVRYAIKARSIAEAHGLDIIFLGKIRSPETVSQLQRKLITLAGLAETYLIQARYMTFDSGKWKDILSIHYKPGDCILCPQELVDGMSIPESDYSLIELYKDQIITADGMIHPIGNLTIQNLLINILNWSGILLIIAVAFGLEANLDSQTIGFMRIIGEITLVGIEILALLFWLRLFQRQR